MNFFIKIYFGTYTDLTTGINLIDSPFEISISPNPVITNCYINISFGSIMKYTLTDLSGRIVDDGIVNKLSSIDMTNLSPGVYILSITGNHGSVIKKIIKE